jgi:hypothetical protein
VTREALRCVQGECEAVSSKLDAEKSAKIELEHHKGKLQMVLKEATSKLEADLSSVRVQIGAESKVMQKLQQHAGKMCEQLEFVKGSIVAAADIRSHLDRYLDNLQVR